MTFQILDSLSSKFLFSLAVLLHPKVRQDKRKGKTVDQYGLVLWPLLASLLYLTVSLSTRSDEPKGFRVHVSP